tara:strand:- start:2333 stop:2674 length:342 start_codon:yes stop_codon:yes gene_type:complete
MRRGYSIAYIAHLMDCSIVKYIQLEEYPLKNSAKMLKNFFKCIEITQEEKRAFLDIYFYDSIEKLNEMHSVPNLVNNNDLEKDTNDFPFNVISLAGRRSIELQKDKEMKKDAD